jgi:hypothetical protein
MHVKYTYKSNYSVFNRGGPKIKLKPTENVTRNTESTYPNLSFHNVGLLVIRLAMQQKSTIGSLSAGAWGEMKLIEL